MNSEIEALLRSGRIPSDNDDDDDSDSMSSDCFELKNVKSEGVQFGDDVPRNSNPSLFDSSEPYVGKTFGSLDEAQKFYAEFARKAGFEICVKSHVKMGVWSSCLLQCKKAGKSNTIDSQMPDEINIPPKRCDHVGKGEQRIDVLVPTDCKARMHVSYCWVQKCLKVMSYESRHNHKMVSSSKHVFMSTSRNVSQTALELIDVFRRSKIGPSRIQQVFQTQAGGDENVGFNLKAVENIIRDLHRKEGNENDAQVAIDYLEKAKDKSGGQFFYRVRYTDENRVKTLVWVDGRSRSAYRSFGDVVTFDTRYQTNMYDMPFALFTGVNHHYQSILFGFALLGDEKEDTFQWVLSTWLEAMDGVTPQTIITAQCQHIGNAIRKVFPHTHHGLCNWYISSKYPDELNNPEFKADYDKCVTKSLTIVEFEQRWVSMIEKYDLHRNKWLSGLYKVRAQWIPAYTKRHFAAGMTTTARSEEMNHYFDQFVSSYTSLKDLIQKTVEDALEKQCFWEQKEDLDCKYYSRPLECKSPLERHAAKVYTKAMFRRFQTEFKKSGRFLFRKVKDGSRDGSVRVYLCRNELASPNRDRRLFTILFCKESGDIKCNCQLFEHLGILCRHLLRFLCNKNYTEIPSKYILQRWTINANKCYTYDKVNEQFDPFGLCYNHHAQPFMGFVQDAACSKEGYRFALEMIAQEKVISSFLPDIESGSS